MTDKEALSAFRELSEIEGVIPALESSFALAYAKRIARKLNQKSILIVNLSGRGDKDLETVLRQTASSRRLTIANKLNELT